MRYTLFFLLLLTFCVMSFAPLALADISSGLAAYYTYNGNCNDQSGNGNDMYIHGGINFVSGRSDEAIYIDNPQGGTTITEWAEGSGTSFLSNMDYSSFTIAINYKTTDNSEQNGRLLGTNATSTGGYAGLQYNATGRPQVSAGFNDGTNAYNLGLHASGDPSAVATDGNWHWQILIVDRQNNIAYLYLDAHLVESMAFGALGSVSFQDLMVGGAVHNEAYGARKSTVDELRIYSRAISNSDVQQLINGGAGACQADSTTLCLNNTRFQVKVQWWDYSGNTGPGTVVPYGSSDSGMYWFFDSTNWEMLIKVLDGCGTNGHYWVYAAATTDVQYKLYVTDTSTGATKEYDNPPHNASPAITDSSAFATCP